MRQKTRLLTLLALLMTAATGAAHRGRQGPPGHRPRPRAARPQRGHPLNSRGFFAKRSAPRGERAEPTDRAKGEKGNDPEGVAQHCKWGTPIPDLWSPTRSLSGCKYYAAHCFRRCACGVPTAIERGRFHRPAQHCKWGTPILASLR